MRTAVRSPLLLLMLAGIAAPAALAAAAGTEVEAPTPAPVEQSADATLTISGRIIALGVGYEWAHGVLTYRGRTYPFLVRGVSVMDIGAAKITGTGEVFNLKSLADFEGRYTGTTFGSAVSHGASLALIKNEHGVTIRARSSVSGIRLNFSGNGFRIRFTTPPTTSEDRS